MKKKPNNIMRDEEKWITDQFPRPQADGNYTNSGSRADSNPQPQESWEIDIFNEVDFRIEDGILEIWRRASPDGDWEGRTGTTKELKDAIRTLLEDQQGELYAWFNKALLKQKKEIIEEIGLLKKPLIVGENFKETKQKGKKEPICSGCGEKYICQCRGYNKAIKEYNRQVDEIIKRLQ